MSLSLGQSIKQIQENQKVAEENQLKSQSEKKQREIMKSVNWIKKLFSEIKQNTLKISNNEKKAVFDKKGRLVVSGTRSKDRYNSLTYKFLLNGHDTNIIEHFKKVGKGLPLSDIFDDFQAWMDENDIKNVELTYAHDGVGIESWNNVLLTIK